MPSAPAKLMTDGVISFEGPELSAKIALDGEGRIALSNRRFIHGAQSLRWDWRPGDRLTIQQPIEYYPAARASRIHARGVLSVFHVFVYNESLLKDDKLQFEFAVGDAPAACYFEMGLNYSGWRAATLGFDRDMQGKPATGMDAIRVLAPADAAGGVLYLDQIVPGVINDARFQWPDWNVPRIGPSNAPAVRLAALVSDGLAAPDAQLTQELETIAARLEGPAWKPSSRAALEKRVAALGIAEDKDGIRGRHVLQACQLQNLPRPLAASACEGAAGYILLWDYGALMRDLAVAHRAARTESDRRVYRKSFSRMVRHLIDQGWAAGSSLGTTHHFGYESRPWSKAIFLMRKPLAEDGLLNPMAQALAWYAREFTDLMNPGEGGRRADDMDYLNTVAETHLMLILMQFNPAGHAELLRRFSDFLARTFAEPKRDLGSGFKVDGTAFHHGGHYPAYCYSGARGAADIAWLLRGTRFALPPEALATIKSVLLNAWISSNPQTGVALCGRHPFHESSVEVLAGAFRKLAQAGDRVDSELAAIYLALRPAETARSQELFNAAIVPASLPRGHWSFNYGCYGIHRWGGKMATIKGFNDAVWASEIYTKDNRYGRYQSNGSVQIVARGPNVVSGFVENGWDWNRLPGVTSIHRPLELLDSPVVHTLMLKSPKRFCGSSNLDRRYGVFVMELWEPKMERFDPAFRGLKTVFCFDDRIVCLGSGIVAGDAHLPVETILFQHALTPTNRPTWCNAEIPLTRFPVETTLSSPAWLVDGFGNGYIVRQGGALHHARQRQYSRHNKTKAPTEGDFAAAWIDHGPAPKGAAYEYAILLNATPRSTADFAARPSYRVLRHDAAAHVVYDAVSKVAGYVVFQPGKVNISAVRSVSHPCLVMTKPESGGLRVSIGDPDLNMTERNGVSRPKTHRIAFVGGWRLASDSKAVRVCPNGGDTVLEVVCRDGQPVEFLLREVQKAEKKITPSGLSRREDQGS